MKIFIVLLTALILAALVVPVMAQESVLPPTANKSLIEDNLFIGLASDNQGLQRSSALMLGTIQSRRALAPLMCALWDNPNENVRIAAAWALCQIGDINGINAVFKAVKNDPSLKVMLTCAWYYNVYVQKGTFIFNKPMLVTASE
jgi:HEAT repeat protein